MLIAARSQAPDPHYLMPFCSMPPKISIFQISRVGTEDKGWSGAADFSALQEL